jgi:superfamily II DNA/RNA helicase
LLNFPATENPRLFDMLESLELHRELRLGLQALGYTAATEVQAAVLPAALAGQDLQVSAETGSGKTLAYLLPLAQSLLDAGPDSSPGTQGLVLVPTRELARQVLKYSRALLTKSRLRVQAITGGADFKYQKALLRKDPEILIATPGRLLEHCRKGSADLRALRVLVLDEADRMLDMGFRDDVLGIIEHGPADRQVIMLSASLQHAALGQIAGDVLRSPRVVSVGAVRQPHSSIFHQCILADSAQHKDRLLAALLAESTFQKALVFANKRTTAARLAAWLTHRGLRAACLQGDMSTEERKHVVTRFHDGRIDILCASDVAARGLDIPGIDLVVNYDMPRSGSDYLHRTGRTGRAGASGLAVSLVSAPEWNLMISIQRYLNLEFERRSLPGLKARYHGPKRQKSSGKAVGKKKRSRTPAEKKRSRERHRKQQGKPDRSQQRARDTSNDGFAPLRKRNPGQQ